MSLADRRGECIHSACPHFRRCFVEKNVRAARHARLVVANHALVMAQAALGGLDDADACRPATCSTRAITCSTRPTPRFRCACPGMRGASCGAGCSAPRPAARAPAACGAASAISSRPTRRRRRRWSRHWSPPAFCRPMAGTSASPRTNRCPGSRRFWRWSGIRCWRAPRPATRLSASRPRRGRRSRG